MKLQQRRPNNLPPLQFICSDTKRNDLRRMEFFFFMGVIRSPKHRRTGGKCLCFTEYQLSDEVIFKIRVTGAHSRLCLVIGT